MEAVVLMLILGVGLGAGIGIAAKFLAVEGDPRVGEIEALLPGVNCGACGFPGCSGFARALADGKTTPETCTSSTPAMIHKIAALMGVEAGEIVAKVAVVRCGGDSRLALWSARYNGVADCRSANLVAGGTKACGHGCLGLGTCARVCPVNAIEITPGGLAVVHPDLCIGCGKCVRTCPRSLIAMAPKSAPLHNLCNNPGKGAAKRKVCQVACIGCTKCVKEDGQGRMIMEGTLARVNYANPPPAELAAVCPTHSLQPSLLVCNQMPALQEKDATVHV
ncbi:MAG: Electron transport complex protein rnfB [Lentisphaerae bacterium ADurb.BinA184]|nr:MAG: Electron transport complex protein rnfB [Lentisphaerae bacterium ADurb.BinA184]